MPWSVCQSLPAMPHSQTPAWKPSASSDTAPNTSQIGHRSIRVLVLYRSLNLILYGRRVVIDYDAKCTDLCISSDSQNINGWLKQQKNSSHNKDINIETLLKIMHLRYMTLALWIYMWFCNLSYIYYCLQKKHLLVLDVITWEHVQCVPGAWTICMDVWED